MLSKNPPPRKCLGSRLLIPPLSRSSKVWAGVENSRDDPLPAVDALSGLQHAFWIKLSRWKGRGDPISKKDDRVHKVFVPSVFSAPTSRNFLPLTKDSGIPNHLIAY